MTTNDEAPAALSPVLRIVAAVLRLLPLRSRKALLRRRRAYRRKVRRRAERRGDRTAAQPALYGMDVALAALLPPNGVFVEAGGNDGFEQSNTYLLERFHGWTGLLVEPIPELAAEARRNRPGTQVVEAALVDGTRTGATVSMHYGGLMSVVEGARGSADRDASWVAQVSALGLEEPYQVDVPARTLSSVLEGAGIEQIDLLSLDVEGYELTALAGLDLARHAPRWMLVEVRDEEALHQLTAHLGSTYVLDRRLSPFDALLRHHDVPSPDPAGARPI